jgi:hypothetical protein
MPFSFPSESAFTFAGICSHSGERQKLIGFPPEW